MKNDVIRVLVTTCVVGVGAWWVHRSNASLELAVGRLRAAVEQPSPHEATTGTCAVSIDPRVLRSEVERALSGARLVYDGSESPSKGASTVTAELEAEPEPGPTAEQIKGYDTANAIVEAALKRKVWRPEDVESLRPIMIELDPPNREAIALLIVRSINEGKLDFAGRPGEFF